MVPADGTLAARSSATISACPASRAARQNLADFSRLGNGSRNQAHVSNGSWPCENFSGRAAHRNIPEQLHLWESNHTAHARFDALLENCVFYISRMYEFLHSQGLTRSCR
jgi:hypothetical protein